jgi:hypothetical protein
VAVVLATKNIAAAAMATFIWMSFIGDMQYLGAHGPNRLVLSAPKMFLSTPLTSPLRRAESDACTMASYASSNTASLPGSVLYSSFLRFNTFVISSASAPGSTPSVFHGLGAASPPAAAAAAAAATLRVEEVEEAREEAPAERLALYTAAAAAVRRAEEGRDAPPRPRGAGCSYVVVVEVVGGGGG